MAEVPVPEGFDAGSISVAGERDHDYGEADVNVDGVRYCRDITVPDDAESVGVSDHYADDVAAFLGTSVDGADGDVSDSDADATDGSDDDEDAEQAPTAAEQIDAGVCPWCDDYEGDGVPQHASSAHPDEWAEYKED